MTFRQPPFHREPFSTQPDGSVKVDRDWFGWFLAVGAALSAGQTGTVTLAKITGGGTDGSLTFVNGLITAVVQPT